MSAALCAPVARHQSLVGQQRRIRAAPRRNRRRQTTCGAAAGLLVAALTGAQPLAGQGSDTRRYDIPSEPLERALNDLGLAAGIDVLYESGVINGKRSAPVTGAMTRQAALQNMLRGTGLIFRFTRPTAVLVFPPDHLPQPAAGHAGPLAALDPPRMMLNPLHVTPTIQIGAPSRDLFVPYGRALLTEIDRRLKGNPALSGRSFQARLAVEVDGAGFIRSLRIARSTGDVALDTRISMALGNLPTPGTPPRDMPQPIWFDIAAR